MQKLCRICFSVNNLVSIFDKRDDYIISHMVMDIASVVISYGDKLPHWICSTCLERLNICFNFKINCEKSDAKLRLQLMHSEEKQGNFVTEKNISKDLENISYNNEDAKISDHIELKVKDVCPYKFVPKNLKHYDKTADDLEIDRSLCDSVENGENNKLTAIEQSLQISENDGHSDKILSRKLKNVQCCICGKILSTRYNLKVHMRTHTGEKPFVCSYCDKAFSLGHSLKVHERIHTGDKPLECQMCGMRFAQNAGLVLHKRLHTGETPYKCSVCSAKFRTYSHQTYHMKKHTGDRSHECNMCGKAFYTKCDLQKHTMIHTGQRPYMCSVCGLKYVTKSHFNRHMELHDEFRNFSCKLCNCVFNNNDELLWHKKTHKSKIVTKHKEKFKTNKDTK